MRLERSRALYAERRAAGVCPSCGRARDAAGCLTCARCLRHARESQARQRARPEVRRATSARKAAEYAARRNAGLCPRCGGDRDLPGGLVLCSSCRSALRYYYRRWAASEAPRESLVAV